MNRGKEVFEGGPRLTKEAPRVCLALRLPLGLCVCQLDKIEEEWLFRGGCGDKAEMRILHHPMALDQRMNHIATS